MAPHQDSHREQKSNSTDDSLPIIVAPKLEAVEPTSDFDLPPASVEGVVPFKDLLFVPPGITIDSFTPPRSNHGLIFGSGSDGSGSAASPGAPSVLTVLSTNANPTSNVDLKKPAVVRSRNVVSDELPANTILNVLSENSTVDPSINADSPETAATLLACPGPQPVLRKRPTLLTGFQLASKSSVAPPTLSPSTTEVFSPASGRSFSLPVPERHLLAPVPRTKPTKSPDSASTKRRVRFVADLAPTKAAATSDPSRIPQDASFVDRVRVGSQPGEVQKSFFSESAGAILNYQRDTRYAPVNPQRAAPEKPNKIPEEVRGKRTFYNKCNECEVGEGAYTECEHIDDGPFDITVNEARLGQRAIPKLVEIYGVKYNRLETLAVDKMLSARNISGLLTENVDSNASKYLMHTLHGTLLGYSDGIGITQARKIAALTGLTWRLKNDSLVSQGSKSDVTGGGAMVLKTLQVTTNNQDGSLRQMVVEVDGLWIAVCWVKQQILVSAMIEKDQKLEKKKVESMKRENTKNEPEEMAATEDKAKSSQETKESLYSDSKDGSPKSDDSLNDVSKDQGHKPRSTSMHSWTSGSTEEFSHAERNEFMSKNDSPVKETPQDQEQSKLQILKWKAEGMAIVLRKDLKEFKMPAGGF